MDTNISIIGIGFVGGAMKKSFEEKGVSVKAYDKYKESDSFESCLDSDIMFLCLPTPFDTIKKEYEKDNIYQTCQKLVDNSYSGIVVLKSTVESETTFLLSQKYNLKLVHNPEFLTARTAYHDFHNQKHVVLGQGPNVTENEINTLKNFYSKYYPNAEISICNSTESESMKSFVNCFYSVKIQFFNELYLLCDKLKDCNYSNVLELMLKNGWINPMHTKVPGPDGKLSYGGYCFPKDTNALVNLMKKKKTPNRVLRATINERNIMRKDNVNVVNIKIKK